MIVILFNFLTSCLNYFLFLFNIEEGLENVLSRYIVGLLYL